MITQRFKRFSKKISQHRTTCLHLSALYNMPITDQQTGFIYHPHGFPLEYKRIWFAWRQQTQDPSETSDMGLIFRAEKYFRPGATLELTIPLHNETEKFRGKVVMVRNMGEHFEIGLWLQRRADASRVRIVEQICHIEVYLKEKKYREGPYALNRDRAAAEWITKYASTVPSL